MSEFHLKERLCTVKVSSSYVNFSDKERETPKHVNTEPGVFSAGRKNTKSILYFLWWSRSSGTVYPTLEQFDTFSINLFIDVAIYIFTILISVH